MERYRFDERTQAIIEKLVVPIGIYQVVDGHVATLVASDGLCELFGYRDRAEAIEKMDGNMYWNVHPDDVKRVVTVAAGFIRENKPYNLVCRVMTDKGYRFIHTRGKHITTQTGVRLAVVWYIDEGAVLLDTEHGDSTEKIEELKSSMHALLNNMPAMSFSKSVETGKYLACNQMFADYAHKKTPAEVVGLTDHDIFDKETADHFVADDRMALSMDEPYIFYEAVPDAAGIQRRFQTTKLKFIDETGRPCLLGMCVDVTEMMVMKREAAEIQEESEKIAKEHATFSRLNALSGDYLSIYAVDLNTDYYVEYNATGEYERLWIPGRGDDFFTASRNNIAQHIFLEDLDMFLSIFTRENVMKAIRETGMFTFEYRIMIESAPVYVCLKAALSNDAEPQLIVGIVNIDAQKKREEEYAHNLSAAWKMANQDALTGVKNKHAYIDLETQLNYQIEEGKPVAFALAVFDVNGLKDVNDTRGHQEGDTYIRKACQEICNVFKHSPVFRVGGDEFAVIIQGADYEQLDDRIRKIAALNRANTAANEPVIACGTARYENDRSVAAVFERADANMYEDKKKLKTV